MSANRWFTERKRPSWATIVMPTAACSKVARKRSSLARSAASAILRGEMSSMIEIDTAGSPGALSIIEVVRLIHTIEPFRCR